MNKQKTKFGRETENARDCRRKKRSRLGGLPRNRRRTFVIGSPAFA